jgi:hypothetical protein
MMRARKKIRLSIQTSMIVAAVASLKRNAAWKDKPSNAEYSASNVKPLWFRRS